MSPFRVLRLPRPVRSHQSKSLAIAAAAGCASLVFLFSGGAAQSDTTAAAEIDGSRIEPGRYEYRQQVMLLGQTVELSSFRSVEAGTWRGREVWMVAEETRTPEGVALDSTYATRDRLVPIRRVVVQGDQRLELGYEPGHVRGHYTGADSVSVDIPLEGPVLDGGGLVVAIRALPLAEGYTAELRTISLQSRSEIRLRLSVDSGEIIAVPAGEFETWRVLLMPDTGGASTLWVEREPPHRVIRTESEMAVGGAGVVISELVRDEAARPGSRLDDAGLRPHPLPVPAGLPISLAPGVGRRLAP